MLEIVPRDAWVSFSAGLRGHSIMGSASETIKILGYCPVKSE